MQKIYDNRIPLLLIATPENRLTKNASMLLMRRQIYYAENILKISLCCEDMVKITLALVISLEI